MEIDVGIMTLTADQIAEIEELLRAPGDEHSAFAILRRKFPLLSWTRCDASDVADPPFSTCELFDIHLVDSSAHCVHITSDPARATGVILAKRSAAS